jgi:cytochrome c-type biogenesis protein
MSVFSVLALYFAGIATFASPCVLPMVPLYLGVLAGAEVTNAGDTSHRRLRLAGVGFAIGLGSVFVVLGMGAHAITRSLTGYGQWLQIGAGALMILFGLKLVGLLKLSWFERESRPLLQRVPNVGGFTGGLLFGAGFAIGWTPCVGPVLATALSYAASATSSSLAAGAMLAVYALGLATPLVIASFAASRMLVWVKQLRKYTPAMQRVTGAFLVAFGAYFAVDSLRTTAGLAAADCNGKTACETKIAASQTTLTVEQLPEGPALVEFVSSNCPVCKRMHPVISALEAQCHQGLLVRVNVDDPLGKQLAAHYGISMVPTFVSVDRTGGEVERIIGEQSRERLLLALSDVSGRPCEVTN